jgi:hypothetical protein
LLCFPAIPTRVSFWKNVVLALREWSPALVLDSMFLQETLGLDLLVERVGLDLIHRGYDLGVHDEVHHAIRREIAYAARPCSAILIEILHRPPRALPKRPPPTASLPILAAACGGPLDLFADAARSTTMKAVDPE